MSGQLIEHRAVPLLGRDDRADKLISWSKRMPVGKKWVKDFAHGLRLGFVADGETPRIYIHWKQLKFRSFLDALTFKPERLFFIEYGVCVHHHKGRTKVTLPGVGATKLVLWDSCRPFCIENALSDFYWLIGMVSLSQEGPIFFDRSETQAQVTEATAVAQFHVGKKEAVKTKTLPGKISSPLPKKDLGVTAGEYLLKDALLNQALKNKNGAR